jgi:hypothetical protein
VPTVRATGPELWTDSGTEYGGNILDRLSKRRWDWIGKAEG